MDIGKLNDVIGVQQLTLDTTTSDVLPGDLTAPRHSTENVAGQALKVPRVVELPDDPLLRATELINEYLAQNQPAETDVKIIRDDATGHFVYLSVDKESGEVKRQFPPEEFLELIARFHDAEGIVFDDSI